VQVPYSQGIANRTGPNSCSGRSNRSVEALTEGEQVGYRAAKDQVQSAEAKGEAEGNIMPGDSARLAWALRSRRPHTFP